MQDAQADQLEGFLLPDWSRASYCRPCVHFSSGKRPIEVVLEQVRHVPELHEYNLHLLSSGVLRNQLLETLPLATWYWVSRACARGCLLSGSLASPCLQVPSSFRPSPLRRKLVLLSRELGAVLAYHRGLLCDDAVEVLLTSV